MERDMYGIEGPERTGISFHFVCLPVRQWGLVWRFAHSREDTQGDGEQKIIQLHTHTTLPCSDNSSINPSPIATPTRKLHKI